MGGKDDKIREYDIKKDEWIVLDAIMPLKSCNLFGYIITRNDQYLIIFGGNDEMINGYDTIYIMDINTKSFALSNLKCPVSGQFRAFLVDNYSMTDIIVDGYLRRCWQSDIFKNVGSLPNELINLIYNFYSQEFVHLMQIGKGNHWKILLNDILNTESVD